MRTASQSYTFSGPADTANSSRITFEYSVGSRLSEGFTRQLNYTTTSRKPNPTERKQQPRVIRRMTGFLVEMQSKDARVAFVEAGQTILYDLPAEQLRSSGIEVKNQPFQMDEIEIRTDDGIAIGYRFKPLANKSDAYIETLQFDEERKRKRDLILKEFSKTKT